VDGGMLSPGMDAWRFSVDMSHQSYNMRVIFKSKSYIPFDRLLIK
jgi:hypothetical protein